MIFDLHEYGSKLKALETIEFVPCPKRATKESPCYSVTWLKGNMGFIHGWFQVFIHRCNLLVVKKHPNREE